MEREIEINMTQLHKDQNAILIARLCMALNDLSKLKYLHDLRKEDKSETEKRVMLRLFTGSYIALLMTSHLVEAIDILKGIAASDELTKLILSDAAIQKQWDKLKPYLPGGPSNDLIIKYDRIRNNLVFHYSQLKVLKIAFDEGVKKTPRWKSSYIPSSYEDQLCHFKFAEDLANEAFMRLLEEKHPKNQEELETLVGPKIMQQRDRALSDFLQFGQLFACKYLEKFKLVE